MMRAHQPGSTPIDIPRHEPNPAVRPEPIRKEPVPKPTREPVKTPEKVPA